MTRSRGTAPIVALANGAVVGLVLLAASVSVGALVYGGVAPEHLTLGVRLSLLATLATGLVVALLGSLPGGVAQAQAVTGAILATLATTVVAGVADDPTARLATVLALVAATSLAVGTLFVLVGGLRLGRLVRFLPYPVVGGFVAGSGWLLVLGGGAVASGTGATSASLLAAFPVERAGQWLPALALGAALLVATPNGRRPIAFPLVLAIALAAFYAMLAWTGGDPATWRAHGWLLDAGGGGGSVRLLDPSLLAQVDWRAWALHLPGVATAALVAATALAFNAAGIETETRHRADLDRELRAAGLGNLAAAAFAAPPAFPALATSVLASRLGGPRGPVAGGALAVVAVGLVLGPRLVAWVPASLAGGVLVALGLGMLRSWLVDAWRTLSRLEYAIVVLIVGTIAGFGLLAGVLTGLATAMLLFVVTYARVDAVRHALDGTEARSRMRWGRLERRTLAETGRSRLVLHLQGYLFFGVAHALERGIERHLDDRHVREVVVDFRQVTGADATALASLDALRHDAAARGVRLTFAEVPPPLARAFARRGLTPRAGSGFALASTLDAALEAAERRALAAAPAVDPLATLTERLDALTADDLELMDLAIHLDRLEAAPGTRLLADADEAAGAVYLVAQGQVTTWLERPGHEAVRLETLRGGHLIGDVAFYRGTAPQHAWVVADEPTTLFRLSREGLARLTATDPTLAARFHQLAARQLADRVAHLNRLVEALQR